MAPKPVVSKQPIEQYDANHIMSREKKVITDELLREHKRAEKLAKAIEQITKTFGEIDTIVKKPVTDMEQDSVAKLRLNKNVTEMMEKINGLKINDLKGLLEPSKVTSGASDDDLIDPNVNEETNNLNEEEVKLNDKYETKTYKLDPNTKVFSGSSGERLSQWIFIINDAFTSINVTTDRIKLALVTNYVRGMALNTLMRYKSEAYPTWDGFIKLLREQYEDSNLDYKLRTQFFHLQMENSFPKYLAKFHELLNQLPSLTYDNQTILDKFTDGLTKEMAFHVKREKCQTLNQVIEICNDWHCLTTNNDDKIEKINFVRTNFNSSRGRQSFNNNGVNRSNYQSIRSDNTPYKKIENRRNFSKLFNSGSKNKTKVDMNNVTCYKCNKHRMNATLEQTKYTLLV